MSNSIETSVRVLIQAMAPAAKVKLLRELAAETSPAQPDANRIMRRIEAAKVLGRSTRAIDLLAKQGHLKKIHFPGRTRAGGFVASSVYALLGE